MINVLDTHRLLYRNATITALDLADKTTPVKFYNITDVDVAADIGYTVYTNDAGYICYGSNRELVSSLGLGGSAIVRVSLNGGQSWPIAWIVRNTEDGVTAEDVKYKIYDQQGNVLYDPLSRNYVMPDYLLRSEYSNGIWKEESISVEATEVSIALSEWTTAIRVPSNVTANSIALTGQLRAGQKVLVANEGKARTINNMRFEAGSFGIYYADGNGNMMWTTQSDAFYALAVNGSYNDTWTEVARKLIAMSDTVITADNRTFVLQKNQKIDLTHEAGMTKSLFEYTPALIYTGVCSTDGNNALLYDVSGYDGGILPAHAARVKLRLTAPTGWGAAENTYHIVIKVPYEWFKFNRTVDLDLMVNLGQNYYSGNFSVYVAFDDDNGQYHAILMKQKQATYDEATGAYYFSNYNVQLRCRADMAVSYVEMNPAISAT